MQWKRKYAEWIAALKNAEAILLQIDLIKLALVQ